MTKNSKGFAHIEILMVSGVVVLIGLAGWLVLKNRNSDTKQENQVTKTTPAPSTKKTTQTTVKLDEKAVAALAQSSTKTTPAPSKASSASNTTAQTTPSPAPAATNTNTTPSYSITISSDGCSVSGYSVAGNKIEIGAFNNSKGGSVVYDITSNQTITKSPGGIKGMTAFGRTTDAQGTVLAYHSAPITADSCPPAGN